MNQTRKRILQKLYPTKKVKVVLTDDGLVASFISKVLKEMKDD